MTNHFDYYGVALPVLNKGQVPLGCCLTIKVMDEEGHINYQEYKSPGMHAIEGLGMLETFSDTLRMQIMQQTRGVE